MIKKYGIIGTAILGIASTMYFTYNNWNQISNLTHLKKEVKKTGTTRILAIGDSLTKGYGVTKEESYPGQLERKLKDGGFPVEIINKGRNGETTADLLKNIEELKKENPDIVLITIGGNDVLREVQPKEIQDNLFKIIDSLKETVPSNKIFLMQMQIPPIHGLKYMLAFNSIYPKVAKKEGIHMLSFIVPDVFLEKSLMQSDYIHPNKEGYRKIVEKYILERLEKEM